MATGENLVQLSHNQFSFYFENPGIFTEAQLPEIKKASLARVLCENGDGIREVPADAFVSLELSKYQVVQLY
jgi:hypothetical protein